MMNNDQPKVLQGTSVTAPRWFSDAVNEENDIYCLATYSDKPFEGKWLICRYNHYAFKVDSLCRQKKELYCRGVQIFSEHLNYEAFERMAEDLYLNLDSFSDSNSVEMYLEMLLDMIENLPMEKVDGVLKETEFKTTFLDTFLAFLDPDIFDTLINDDFGEILDTIDSIVLFHSLRAAAKNGLSELSIESKLAIFGGVA